MAEWWCLTCGLHTSITLMLSCPWWDNKIIGKKEKRPNGNEKKSSETMQMKCQSGQRKTWPHITVKCLWQKCVRETREELAAQAQTVGNQQECVSLCYTEISEERACLAGLISFKIIAWFLILKTGKMRRPGVTNAPGPTGLARWGFHKKKHSSVWALLSVCHRFSTNIKSWRRDWEPWSC